MMLKKMAAALNEQVNNELYSAYLYLGMNAYFESCNLKGFASWMDTQAREEVMHGMKIYNFLLERGAEVNLLPIKAPESKWKSAVDIFGAAYEHEQQVTAMINNLVKLAIELDDYATHTFLHWFVTEQVEEEATFSEVLGKVKMAKDSSAMLFLDAELGKRHAEVN